MTNKHFKNSITLCIICTKNLRTNSMNKSTQTICTTQAHTHVCIMSMHRYQFIFLDTFYENRTTQSKKSNTIMHRHSIEIKRLRLWFDVWLRVKMHDYIRSTKQVNKKHKGTWKLLNRQQTAVRRVQSTHPLHCTSQSSTTRQPIHPSLKSIKHASIYGNFFLLFSLCKKARCDTLCGDVVCVKSFDSLKMSFKR